MAITSEEIAELDAIGEQYGFDETGPMQAESNANMFFISAALVVAYIYISQRKRRY